MCPDSQPWTDPRRGRHSSRDKADTRNCWAKDRCLPCRRRSGNEERTVRRRVGFEQKNFPTAAHLIRLVDLATGGAARHTLLLGGGLQRIMQAGGAVKRRAAVAHSVRGALVVASLALIVVIFGVCAQRAFRQAPATIRARKVRAHNTGVRPRPMAADAFTEGEARERGGED